MAFCPRMTLLDLKHFSKQNARLVKRESTAQLAANFLYTVMSCKNARLSGNENAISDDAIGN